MVLGEEGGAAMAWGWCMQISIHYLVFGSLGVEWMGWDGMGWDGNIYT